MKSEVLTYKNIIAQTFHKLSRKENGDNLDMYLKHQEIICDLLIVLEEKTTVDYWQEICVKSRVKHTSLVKVSQFDLPHFYDDSEH